MGAGKAVVVLFIVILGILAAGGFYRIWDEDVIQTMKDDYWDDTSDSLPVIDLMWIILIFVIFFIFLILGIAKVIESKHGGD